MTYQPLYRHRPPHRWTNGDLAAKVGTDLGLPPDDEQRWILDTIYAETEVDKPASFEVDLIGPRQNIKTSTYGIAAISDLFVFEIERHIWSSHLLDTSKGTFRDFRQWIDSNHEYAEQVHYYEGHQDLAIIHSDSGRRIDFRSRTGKGSRGLTGVKRITLDEALFLEAQHVGAVFPTMLTKPGSQVRVASSAGVLKSKELRRIRDRGRAGKDPRGAYLEYGAERRKCQDRHCTHRYAEVQGCALDDRELWWQSCCALWSGRIHEESIEEQRSKMPPEEFMREFLTWWEDPESEGGALPYRTWLDLADHASPRGAQVVFGLDLTGERDVWVSVGWLRDDGHPVLTLANEGRPVAAHTIVAECKRLQDKWGGTIATSAFLEELEAAGVQTAAVSGPDFAIACGALEDRIAAGTVHHHDQPALNDGIRAARWRVALQNGERAFQLKDMPEVGPAAAAVRALHGLSRQEVEPWGMYA